MAECVLDGCHNERANIEGERFRYKRHGMCAEHREKYPEISRHALRYHNMLRDKTAGSAWHWAVACAIEYVNRQRKTSRKEGNRGG